MVTVKREGQYQHSKVDKANNIYIYSGAENTLKITRVYSTKWLCDYHMIWFPFDTQVYLRKNIFAKLSFNFNFNFNLVSPLFHTTHPPTKLNLM